MTSISNPGPVGGGLELGKLDPAVGIISETHTPCPYCAKRPSFFPPRQIERVASHRITDLSKNFCLLRDTRQRQRQRQDAEAINKTKQFPLKLPQSYTQQEKESTYKLRDPPPQRHNAATDPPFRLPPPLPPPPDLKALTYYLHPYLHLSSTTPTAASKLLSPEPARPAPPPSRAASRVRAPPTRRRSPALLPQPSRRDRASPAAAPTAASYLATRHDTLVSGKAASAITIEHQRQRHRGGSSRFTRHIQRRHPPGRTARVRRRQEPQDGRGRWSEE